jgi:hypothetical protein
MTSQGAQRGRKWSKMLTAELSSMTIAEWRYWGERAQEGGIYHNHTYARICFQCAELLRTQQVRYANR